jgi:hypothetical protein
MADVLVLTFLRLARLGSWRRMGALEHLQARLFVHTDNETTVLRETQGVDIQVAAVPGLGLACRGMAIEPVHAPRRFAVSIVEKTPESGAAHRPGPRVGTEGRCHVSETPPCRGAVVIGGRTRGDRQDSDTRRGGKSAAAALGAAHPANRPARAQGPGCARGRRSGGDRACQPPPGDSAERLEQLHVGCGDNERPGLGGGMGTREGLQTLAFIVRSPHWTRKRHRHGSTPEGKGEQ